MIETLSLTQMILLGLLGVGAMLAAMVRIRSSLALTAAMMFLSSLGVAVSYSKVPVRTFLMPVQAQRSELYSACGLLLLVAMMVHVGRIAIRSVPIQGLFLLVILMYAGLMRIATGNGQSGFQTIGFALATMLPLLFLLPALLREWDDWFAALRAMLVASGVWNAAVLWQLTLDWRKLVEQTSFSRFQGLTSNPQQAGLFLCMSVVLGVFLMLNDPKIRYRWVWAAIGGLSGLLLMWTGSRTGASMAVIGMMGVLYARAGRAILFLPVAAGLGYAAYSLLAKSGVDLGFDRLTSTSDTRGQAWVALIRNITDNPVTGVGASEEAAASENSLLYGMASYGVGIGVLIVVFMLFSAWQCLRLFRRRFSLAPQQRALVDCILAFNAVYFAGSMLEGYVIARVNQMVVYMLLFAAMAVRLLEKTEQEQAHGDTGAWHGEHHDDGGDHYSDAAGYGGYDDSSDGHEHAGDPRHA